MGVIDTKNILNVKICVDQIFTLLQEQRLVHWNQITRNVEWSQQVLQSCATDYD